MRPRADVIVLHEPTAAMEAAVEAEIWGHGSREELMTLDGRHARLPSRQAQGYR